MEDDDGVRVLAESYLEEQGHPVLSAGTPEGALALLEKAPHVDLLFTDIDLHGDIHADIELARHAVDRWSHLKVLYASGRAVTDGMKARFVRGAAFLQTRWSNCARPSPSVSISSRSRIKRAVPPLPHLQSALPLSQRS